MFSQINVRTKSYSTWYLYIESYVIKFIKMTLNSKHKADRKLRKTKQ